MNSVYYTTMNGNITGCASYFFRDEKDAKQKQREQNDKAMNLGIKAFYNVAEVNIKNVDPKLVRPLQED